MERTNRLPLFGRRVIPSRPGHKIGSNVFGTPRILRFSSGSSPARNHSVVLINLSMGEQVGMSSRFGRLSIHAKDVLDRLNPLRGTHVTL